jgi:hypothetical protein
MPIVDPERLPQYLDGVKFPAEKKEIVSHSERQAAPFEVTYALQQLPEKKFGSVTEVQEEIKRVG